jgi:integrase
MTRSTVTSSVVTGSAGTISVVATVLGAAPALLTEPECLLAPARFGPLDHLCVEDVLAVLAQLPDGLAQTTNANVPAPGAAVILRWLLGHPGDGWQARWLAAGADSDLSWVDTIADDTTRSVKTRHAEIMGGLAALLLARAVFPSYDFLVKYRSSRLFERVRHVMRPDLFTQLRDTAAVSGLRGLHQGVALVLISKIVLHTGKDVDHIDVDDMLELHAWGLRRHGGTLPGLHAAWVLLSGIGMIPANTTLRGALRPGQRSTSDLVDHYPLRSRGVRDILIRYLDERRPAMDYSSLRTLAGDLAGSFWVDIERCEPGIDTLKLSDELAQKWRERLRVVNNDRGDQRPRKSYYNVLRHVRAFYLDLQEWALDDPSWVPSAVPSPVRQRDLQGFAKERKRTQAAMHQRTRERLPHLPLLAEHAERLHHEAAALLEAAGRHAPDDVFDHCGTSYRRIRPTSTDKTPRNQGHLHLVEVQDLTTGETGNLTRREDEAFWTWASIQTLRHTGVRAEELLEITHLALVSYTLPESAEVVPLLQIVPSKSNEERLLLISPELASVLATVISRLRSSNAGVVALVRRYDPHERVTGPPLPHLFQRRFGTRREVISSSAVRALLNKLLATIGLHDQAGEPLQFTPHDFRRMFATEAVTGGLPVHITARLLGHSSITTTTKSYIAVFPDELIRTYRAFLERRRAFRSEAEYREPTTAEWSEFEGHFQLRKLELGSCGRPYGTPCQHEHACIRCPMLRVDPAQRSRLVEIIHNLNDRIKEARINGWIGEVQGLQSSLDAAAKKLVSLDRLRDKGSNRPTNIGMPTIAT